MNTIDFSIERDLPCECLALASTPFPDCPECAGEGHHWQELIVAVEYGYSRASRGSRDRYGCPLEPDEPASTEIQSVTDEYGHEVELTSDEEDRADEQCLEDAEERREEARAEAAERRYELWRDSRMSL